MLTAVCLPAAAQHLLDTDYYPIFASSSAELMEELAQKGPNGFYANTEWNIKTRYHYTELNGRCLLDFSNVDLNITYNMPRWVDKLQAPLGLQYKWDSWYAKLQMHESNHGVHGKKAYQEIQQGFLRFSHAANCAQLQSNLETLTSDTLARYARADKLYDQATNHGETEGVNSSLGNVID